MGIQATSGETTLTKRREKTMTDAGDETASKKWQTASYEKERSALKKST
jgi:hypothetical protein